MEDKYQLVFTKEDLQILDCALWMYQKDCVFRQLDFTLDDVNTFVSHFMHIIDLRNYLRHDFDVSLVSQHG